VDLKAILAGRELDDDQFVQAGGGVSLGTGVGRPRLDGEKDRAFTEEEFVLITNASLDRWGAERIRWIAHTPLLRISDRPPCMRVDGSCPPRSRPVHGRSTRWPALGAIGVTRRRKLFDLVDDSPMSGKSLIGQRFTARRSIGKTVGQSDDARLLRYGLSAPRIQSA
jgi:hypothetical protein